MARVENPGVAVSGCGIGVSSSSTRAKTSQLPSPSQRSCWLIGAWHRGIGCGAGRCWARSPRTIRSHLIPILCHALALAGIGKWARGGGEIIAHVVGAGGCGDRARDRRVAQDVLEEELAPASAAEFASPAWHGLT